MPRSESFDSLSEAKAYAETLRLPVFVKPVDSSGSKGVTQLENLENFGTAYSHALTYSRAKRVVVEERIGRHGYQVAGDGFVVDGQLAFRCFGNEHFDKLCNGLVPIGESFPAIPRSLASGDSAPRDAAPPDAVGDEDRGAEFRFCFHQGRRVLLPGAGPRNGGNLIPEVTKYATGVDLVKYTVDAALGLDCSGLHMEPPHGYYSSYIVHALREGTCTDLWMSERFRSHVVEQNIWVKPGDAVPRFQGSNGTLGTAILRFESEAEMLAMMDNMENDIHVRAA